MSFTQRFHLCSKDSSCPNLLHCSGKKQNHQPRRIWFRNFGAAFGFWLRCPWELSCEGSIIRLHQQPLLVGAISSPDTLTCRHSPPSWPVSRLRRQSLQLTGILHLSCSRESSSARLQLRSAKIWHNHLEGNPKVRNMQLVRLHIWPRWKKPQLRFIGFHPHPTIYPRHRTFRCSVAPSRLSALSWRLAARVASTPWTGKIRWEEIWKAESSMNIMNILCVHIKIFTYKIQDRFVNLNIPFLKVMSLMYTSKYECISIYRMLIFTEKKKSFSASLSIL